jgi:hypothetical protein
MRGGGRSVLPRRVEGALIVLMSRRDMVMCSC